VFRAHIAASQTSGLPLIIHARAADDAVARVLREERAPPGVMHCFSSGRGLAEAALDLGFYISISGIVTFKNAEELRAIVRDVPLERLLVETDAPISRRCRIAGGATSRPMSRRPPLLSPR